MMSFVTNPLHPESDTGACTSPDRNALPLEPVLETPVTDVSLCWLQDGRSVLAGTACAGGVRIWIAGDSGAMEAYPLELEHNALLTVSDVVMPRITRIREQIWMTCGHRQGGTFLLRCAGNNPAGVYVVHARITGEGSGASLFCDEDGTLYWVWDDGKVAKLNAGMTGLETVPVRVEAEIWKNGHFRYGKEDTRIGTTGACVVRDGDLYYMFCGEAFSRLGDTCTDTFVAVSRSITGPYSRRYLVIPHGGAAAVVRRPGGGIVAAFAGSGRYAACPGKAAVIPLETVEEGYLRPATDRLLEGGPVAALKPTGDMPIRDPQIVLGPDGLYYLTGTSNQPNNSFWAPNDGIHLWRSPDLKAWESLGLVWDVRREGTWQNHIRAHFAIWAPEIHYTRGQWWLTYSMQGESTGLLRSLSGLPEGPYADMGRMTTRDIDSSLFTDADGEVYYVWQDGRMARMKTDMSGFAEEPCMLLTDDGTTVGYEGAFVIRHKGWYILGAAEWNGDYRIDGTYDLMYAVSRNLRGPYSARAVAVPHGGHGTMFTGADGHLYSTLFGNDRTAPFRTSLGIVRLEMNENGGIPEIRPYEEPQ